MTVDTSKLFGWASAETVSGSAEELTTAGSGVDSAIDEAAQPWNAMPSAYISGPEEETVWNAFDIIKEHGDAIREMAKMAGDALDDFSTAISNLKGDRESALAKAREVNRKINSGEELDPGEESAAQGAVDDVYSRYEQAAQACADAIGNITVTTKPGGGFVASPEGGLLPAAAQSAMEMFQVESFTYRDLQPVSVVYAEYIPDGYYISPWARWRTEDGKFSPRIGIVYGRKYRTEFHSKVVWEDRGEITDHWRPNWKPTDTKWRRWLSEHSALYQKVIDQDPTRWNAPLSDRPKWYNVWGKGKEWVSDFGTAGKGTKLLKGGNVVLTAVTVGVTFHDEKSKRYNELAAEHPDWTQEELEAAANEAGAVRTVAKTGVDFGAGMAGAAVGTAIGGPIGTVVGFGVGMGLSYLADKTGLKEGAADVVEDAWEGAKGWVGGLFD